MVLAEKPEKMSAKILDEMKLAWSQVSNEGAEKRLNPECIFKGMQTKQINRYAVGQENQE